MTELSMAEIWAAGLIVVLSLLISATCAAAETAFTLASRSRMRALRSSCAASAASSASRASRTASALLVLLVLLGSVVLGVTVPPAVV